MYYILYYIGLIKYSIFDEIKRTFDLGIRDVHVGIVRGYSEYAILSHIKHSYKIDYNLQVR